LPCSAQQYRHQSSAAPFDLACPDYSKGVGSASMVCARMLFLTASRRYLTLALRVSAR
jgi:hypothetical protein